MGRLPTSFDVLSDRGLVLAKIAGSSTDSPSGKRITKQMVMRGFRGPYNTAIRASLPNTSTSRRKPVARSAAAYVASRARVPNRPGTAGRVSVPKVNIQIPDIGRGIRDFFGNAAPQDTLFREIGNRLRNPSRR